MSDDLEALIIALRIQAETKQAQQNIDGLTSGLDRLDTSAKKAKQTLSGLRKVSDFIPDDAPVKATKLADGVKKIEPAAKSATSGLFGLKNMARTALGTFEAMAIFFITRFVGQAITKTIDSLKQLELSLYKISIAEASLSKSGVDILPKDLVDIAKEITKTFNFISEIDAMKIVGQVSLLTKDLRLTKEQIRDLAIAIPALARSTGESIEETTAAIATGIAKNGRGLADQNVQVNAQIIAQKAVSLGLVATEEAYKNLTAEQKQYIDVSALVAIITDAANESLEKQGDLANSVTDRVGNLSSTWENLLTQAGVLFAPAIKLGLDIAISSLKTFQGGLEALRQTYVGFMGVMVGGWVAFSALIDDPMMKIDKFRELFHQASFEAMQMLESSMTPKLGADTLTGTPPPSGGDPEGEVEDLQGALEKMNNEILEAQLKLAQDMEDAAIDLGRKMEDITIEYAKKRADAEREYATKVSDINRDYANKIADINAKQQESRAKFRADEQQKEREHQNRLQEMREKFLMDMDDALHARDARQILKLIKQYDLDKLQAERDFALQQESARKEEELRQQSFANERKAAERDRKAKLAEAQRDYADKLAKLKADEEAERTAAQLKYEREKQDLEKAMKDRLEIVAANLVAEFNLTNDGLGAIVALYRQYYAEVVGIYAAMRAMMGGSKNIYPTLGGGNPVNTGAPATNKGGGNKIAGHMAEGGTIIANQPTSVVFGEAGMEAATFTPIGRTGQDVNKIFSSLSGEGGGSMGGAVSIELLLSPDLESRIVSNTLNKTAQVFVKTMRSKR